MDSKVVLMSLNLSLTIPTIPGEYAVTRLYDPRMFTVNRLTYGCSVLKPTQAASNIRVFCACVLSYIL